MTSSHRQYEGIWKRIATRSDTTPVKLTCHPNNVQRIIIAVRKEKAIANNIRKNLAMPRYGKLNSSVELANGKATISFVLQFNGDML